MNLKVLSKVKFVFAPLVFLCVVNFGQLIAQPNSIKEITNNKYALENIIDGIRSENNGVKRSSIYFVGKYKIFEAGDFLIEQLEQEQNPANRILIARVLYELKTRNGLLAVKKLAASDKNDKVKRISYHIYNEYLKNDIGKKLSSSY